MSMVTLIMMGNQDIEMRGLEKYLSMMMMFQQRQLDPDATSSSSTTTVDYCYHHDRRQQVEDYRIAVLDEQLEQWATDKIDPERLAQVSRELSQFSEARARVLASHDDKK
jgi:hypothetical protein